MSDKKDTAFSLDAQQRIKAELTELRQRRDRMTDDFEGDRDTVAGIVASVTGTAAAPLTLGARITPPRT